MTKPHELAEAELIYRLCRAYRALPEPGALLDQPVWMLRMEAILELGGYFERQEQGGA